MDRSRIIRNIIAVISLACCIFLVVCLFNLMGPNSPVSIWFKLGYSLAILISILGYARLKNIVRESNVKDSVGHVYKFIFLAIIVVATRLVGAILFRNESFSITPGIQDGLGSYLVYGLGKILRHPMYSVIILNTLVAFASAIFVKKIVENITKSDTLSGIASVVYIFIPQLLMDTTIYSRYSKFTYSMLFILVGIYLLLKIIDKIKIPKFKDKKFITMSIILSVVIILDSLFGGLYITWLFVILTLVLVSRNIDYINLSVSEGYKRRFKLKTQRRIDRLERKRISKLVIVTLIVTIGIAVAIVLNIFVTHGMDFVNATRMYENMLISLCNTPTYYMIIVCISLLVELINFILRRGRDSKSTLIKALFISSILIACITQTNYILNTMLIIDIVLNIGNIFYNREEKIKLLNERY